MSDDVILDIDNIFVRHEGDKLDVEITFRAKSSEFAGLELTAHVDQVHSLDLAVEHARKKVLAFAEGLRLAADRQFFDVSQ